jgi:hypothetical protein
MGGFIELIIDSNPSPTYSLIKKNKHGDLCTMCSIIKSEMYENTTQYLKSLFFIIFFKGSINYLFHLFSTACWLIIKKNSPKFLSKNFKKLKKEKKKKKKHWLISNKFTGKQS